MYKHVALPAPTLTAGSGCEGGQETGFSVWPTHSSATVQTQGWVIYSEIIAAESIPLTRIDWLQYALLELHGLGKSAACPEVLILTAEPPIIHLALLAGASYLLLQVSPSPRIVQFQGFLQQADRPDETPQHLVKLFQPADMELYLLARGREHAVRESLASSHIDVSRSVTQHATT